LPKGEDFFFFKQNGSHSVYIYKMKLISVFVFVSFITINTYSQGAGAYFDDRGFLYTFMNGRISQQEIIKIDSFRAGYNYVTYIDQNGNFKFIHNHKKYTIFSAPPTQIQTSNYLFAYMLGSQLGVFNGRQSKRVESFTNRSFKLGDSILGYIDNMDRLKVYTYDTTVELMNFANHNTYTVGDNIVAFRTLDDRLQAYYRGEIHTVDPYMVGDFQIARDMMAFHDYLTNFKVFDHGKIEVLESYRVDYKLTNNILTYTSNVGEFIVYSDGEKKVLLSTKPKQVWQKRNLLAYSDNAGNFFVYYQGKVIQLENYTPDRVEIWDDLLVYQDMYGSLHGLFYGEKQKVSDAIAKEWWLQNRCVVYYDLVPGNKAVWNNGKIYRYSANDDIK